MIISPQVSVVCLCYNQSRWVEEAVTSVLNQTYPNIQLIIIDDCSTDDSPDRIKKIKKENPSVEIILSTVNRGNCSAFNKALKRVTGDYVIDFAADDVMMPDRVEKQVKFFQNLDETYGVVFTDAKYIDAGGEFIRNHYEYLRNNKLVSTIPQGDVYCDVLSRYFISSPTMMIKKKVFDDIGGYDESLAYEDFDFWVRSSRIYKYGFLNESLTKVRKTDYSMSTSQYRKGDKQLHSTYLVCCKAMHLNRDEEDVQALLKRIRYELRQSVFSENSNESKLFYELLVKMDKVTMLDRVLRTINQLGLPLSWARNLYNVIRFNELR